MNFISPLQLRALADAAEILTIEDAHIWRSRIVDKCAEAERRILELLTAGGVDWSSKAPLSQKMESLNRLLLKDDCPIRAKKIKPLLERLKPLSIVRSELVHSTMTVAEIEGERVAVLRIAAGEGTCGMKRTILSLSRLKACYSELSQIANSLGQEANRR